MTDDEAYAAEFARIREDLRQGAGSDLEKDLNDALDRAEAELRQLPILEEEIKVAFDRADAAVKAAARAPFVAMLRGLPPDLIVARPLDGSGNWTASAMAAELEAGTDRGREYASDIIKVARDLLSRKASSAT